ncbi:tRNA(Ile)-lysidine synthase [Brucella endophytica]|uniref:tRNA(Ile)-lysidine synthase n=1 Tax=Brucella endophytica TaxID=1963359 RepID=A0A916WG40_9HYPH|nr:tRNA(Ile)-lysidine synthase [Brucella endophytica]
MAAVSGGGDSLALLILLRDYFSTREVAPRLIAVTVDHGLRPESADEARAVARLCREHGIEHRIMRWEGEKPGTGIPAAAREARYRLLTEAAGEAGARIIFTGHTRDDQIETFLMREVRGEGRGLAGMASVTLLGGQFWLVRPLLNVGRQDLRDFLNKRQIEWFDDPTNENPAFERPRVRAARGANPSLHARPSRLAARAPQSKGARHEENEALLNKIASMAATRQAEGKAVAGFLAGSVSIEAGDVASIEAEALAGAGQDVAALALSVIVAAIGGRSFLSGVAERERLHLHLKGQGPARLALSRTVIQRGARRHLIWREARGLPGLDLKPGERGIWDGRFEVANHLPDGEILRIAPPSAAEYEQFSREKGIEREKFRRAAVLAGPAVYMRGRLMDIPALSGGRFLPEGVALKRRIALYDHFLPGHDIMLANAVRRLFGLADYPAPPLF